MSKTEKALRWRFALGVCAVLSFVYGVLFLVSGTGLVYLMAACSLWTLTVIFVIALVAIAYRQMTEQNRENLR